MNDLIIQPYQLVSNAVSFRPPPVIPFKEEVETAIENNENLWEKYCLKYYTEFESYPGNIKKRYDEFGTKHGDEIKKRIGNILGHISGIPYILSCKCALVACGLMNVRNHITGIDCTDDGYASSVFYSVINKYYKDTVQDNDRIEYIAQNGITGKGNEPAGEISAKITADQTLVYNYYNKALLKSKQEEKPVRVFSTDHDEHDDKIRYHGVYRITAQYDRLVNEDGDVVLHDGFKQYVFTLEKE